MHIYHVRSIYEKFETYCLHMFTCTVAAAGRRFARNNEAEINYKESINTKRVTKVSLTVLQQ